MDIATDEVLLRGIAMGNEGAFSVFYDRYEKLAYSLAYRILKSSPDAEEVVQDAFVNIWRMAATFDVRRGVPRTWLLSVVHHQAIDTIRRNHRQPRSNPFIETRETVTRGPDVEKEVFNSLDRQTIVWALSQIQPEQWKVIELAYFDGYTHVEIAQRLGLPLGTVKGRIRIGMEKLRSLLASIKTGD